jgi:DNA-binding MarR family transcriptional regulator
MPRKMAREPNAAAAKVGTPTNQTLQPPAQLKSSKIALVLDLLRRQEGATLAELIEATGWLPHSARAVLTGLRKKGHTIERAKRGELTCYHLAQSKA